ncbi:hypothetical protein Tco_1320632 [Tanacetum coccineum]
MLSYKLECKIWGIFGCSPRCSLEEGLTFLEGDGDINKLYDIAKKTGDDVGGSSIHCDLVHENVIYNDLSLPSIEKERSLNNVVLDDVVTDTLAYTLPLVKERFQKKVATGGHGRGLGRLIGLNVATVDDDPQVTKDLE